jgi:hypothetical protein
MQVSQFVFCVCVVQPCVLAKAVWSMAELAMHRADQTHNVCGPQGYMPKLPPLTAFWRMTAHGGLPFQAAKKVLNAPLTELKVCLSECFLRVLLGDNISQEHGESFVCRCSNSTLKMFGRGLAICQNEHSGHCTTHGTCETRRSGK